ncbi:hypothetical protein [Salibacterium aidingense]|uniref:hypothetical protein n=1 Tax=Salibacterium aidingense TaxID=384933 RepID=UPI003BD58E5A
MYNDSKRTNGLKLWTILIGLAFAAQLFLGALFVFDQLHGIADKYLPIIIHSVSVYGIIIYLLTMIYQPGGKKLFLFFLELMLIISLSILFLFIAGQFVTSM